MLTLPASYRDKLVIIAHPDDLSLAGTEPQRQRGGPYRLWTATSGCPAFRAEQRGIGLRRIAVELAPDVLDVPGERAPAPAEYIAGATGSGLSGEGSLSAKVPGARADQAR